jgi:hypothetical protein
MAFEDFLGCREHLDHVGTSFNEILGFSSGSCRVLMEFGDELLLFFSAKFVCYLNQNKRKGEKNDKRE